MIVSVFFYDGVIVHQLSVNVEYHVFNNPIPPPHNSCMQRSIFEHKTRCSKYQNKIKQMQQLKFMSFNYLLHSIKR